MGLSRQGLAVNSIQNIVKFTKQFHLVFGIFWSIVSYHAGREKEYEINPRPIIQWSIVGKRSCISLNLATE